VIYPLSEVFSSLQGEGLYAGTRMTFIRFAGCTVGRPYTREAKQALGLNVYQERCEDWSGASFACDTDFRSKTKLSVEEIMKLPAMDNAMRVCLTGGEPLMHDLYPLLHALHEAEIKVHLETSGTIPVVKNGNWDWVTVSPKKLFLPSVLREADEIKVLVGKDFDDDRFNLAFASTFEYRNKLWVQPINGEFELDRDNIAKCIRLTEAYPWIRLSTQVHKIWKVR
jgi:7-carboxy-7-deazaguanine synthase